MNKEEEFEYAIVLENEGKYDDALEIFHKLLDEDFHSAAMNGMIGGLHFFKRKDPVTALPFLLENVRLSPKSELASITLFHALNRSGRADEAIAEMNRFLSLTDSEEYRQLMKETGIGGDPDDPQS